MPTEVPAIREPPVGQQQNGQGRGRNGDEAQAAKSCQETDANGDMDDNGKGHAAIGRGRCVIGRPGIGGRPARHRIAHNQQQGDGRQDDAGKDRHSPGAGIITGIARHGPRIEAKREGEIADAQSEENDRQNAVRR